MLKRLAKIRHMIKENIQHDNIWQQFEENFDIVYDDFLKYKPFKTYDLIVMNPPFSNGCTHLLKALDVIDEIITAHTETISGLKDSLDEFKKYEADAQKYAETKKELDELKKKKADPEEKDGDDNWFAEDDDNAPDKRSAEIESKIEDLEKKQDEFRQEQAVLNWQKEADAFARDHEDFNTLVYEKLEPMLDEQSGDPAVLAAYKRWQDKSPAGAYEFARKFFGIEEKLAAVPQKNETEAKPAVDPTKGKAGLDRINSEDFAEPKRQHGNMIDEVFG